MLHKLFPKVSIARPLQDRLVGLMSNMGPQDPSVSYLKALISPVRRPKALCLIKLWQKYTHDSYLRRENLPLDEIQGRRPDCLEVYLA